jgi:hypothetical protein
MCEQQFQAEVMDELKMLDDIPSDITKETFNKVEVCLYCGNPKINNYTPCCGELHFCWTRD